MDFDFALIDGVSAVVLIVAFIQIAKMLGFPKKFAPILAIGLGVGASIAFNFYGTEPLFEAIVMGIAAGLVAVGGYSGAKNTLQALHKK